jgi:hypothetical protein
VRLTILAVVALSTAPFLLASATEPTFVTSDPNGGRADGDYYIHNNLWNSSKYTPCTSRLYASSKEHWYVLAKMNNKTGDGAVKTYPNVHRDYHDTAIDAFESITSHFADKTPQVGIYNVAYDIWINGIASPGCTEIMIWTENFHQAPGGRYVQDATFGGRNYKVYKTPNNRYIALVAASPLDSGSIDLLEIIKWTIAKEWLPGKSTLGQICFGVETVSTDDAEAKFEVTAFSIDAKLRSK